jgi:hypothetical protein
MRTSVNNWTGDLWQHSSATMGSGSDCIAARDCHLSGCDLIAEEALLSLANYLRLPLKRLSCSGLDRVSRYFFCLGPEVLDYADESRSGLGVKHATTHYSLFGSFVSILTWFPHEFYVQVRRLVEEDLEGVSGPVIWSRYTLPGQA